MHVLKQVNSQIDFLVHCIFQRLPHWYILHPHVLIVPFWNPSIQRGDPTFLPHVYNSLKQHNVMKVIGHLLRLGEKSIMVSLSDCSWNPVTMLWGSLDHIENLSVGILDQLLWHKLPFIWTWVSEVCLLTTCFLQLPVCFPPYYFTSDFWRPLRQLCCSDTKVLMNNECSSDRFPGLLFRISSRAVALLLLS